MEIVSDMLKHPLFPEKELGVVREVNRQQFLVNSTRVEVISRKHFNRALFGESHPFGRYAEEEDYGRITPEVLKEFYRTHYHSGNCSVYVSGNVTPEIVHCIEEQIGSAAWGEIREMSKIQLPEPCRSENQHIFIEREDALQSSLKMGDFVMDCLHPDFLKCRIMVTLFGGYFGSRLMSNIREDKGYTYGIGAGVINYPGRSVLAISTEADNCYADSIIREVYNEMDRLCNDLPSQEELEMVKSYMLGDLSRSYEGPFSLSDAWIYVETAGVGDDFFVRSMDAIRNVTREEIRMMAQKYLRKETLIDVVAGKKM
jgi:predicted Zn-dependent peptidase